MRSDSVAIRATVAVAVAVTVFMGGVVVGRYTPVPDPLGTAESADNRNFQKAKRLIKEKYVRPVNDHDLIVGASKGLVSGTGDPYSAFLTTDEVKDLNAALSGTVEGIGVEIGQQTGQVTVIAPIPESPADKAGIKAGDIIVGVEDEPTLTKTIDEVAKKIRGPKGTTVRLKIQTPGQPPRDLTLTRETVKSPSVKLEYRDNVAVFGLSRFGDDTKAEIDKAVADIQAKRPRGIVLDLRGNPGGYLQGAVEVASLFLESGTVVKEQFAHGKTESQEVKKDGRLVSLPLVVLVDKGSASASEITAGALRDNRGIKLVGEKTFGKGSVQELENLENGAVLKLTIAEWLTPNGTSISKQGLSPDVPVPSTDEEAQLQAALGLLK